MGGGRHPSPARTADCRHAPSLLPTPRLVARHRRRRRRRRPALAPPAPEAERAPRDSALRASAAPAPPRLLASRGGGRCGTRRVSCVSFSLTTPCTSSSISAQFLGPPERGTGRAGSPVFPGAGGGPRPWARLGPGPPRPGPARRGGRGKSLPPPVAGRRAPWAGREGRTNEASGRRGAGHCRRRDPRVPAPSPPPLPPLPT